MINIVLIYLFHSEALIEEAVVLKNANLLSLNITSDNLWIFYPLKKIKLGFGTLFKDNKEISKTSQFP